MTATTGKEVDPNMRALRALLWRWAVVLIVLAVAAAWATWRMQSAAAHVSAGAARAMAPAVAEPQVAYWTCTMHPEVHQPGPGDCPICGMTLVPKYAGSDTPGVAPVAAEPAAKPGAPAKQWYRCTMPECGDVGSDNPESRCPVCGMKREPVGMMHDDSAAHEITLSPRAQRLAEVATEPIQRRTLSRRIRTVGKIGYDETRHKMVSAWSGGRIDKLFADFTGMQVNEGDHLVEIYSPELLTAQEEYLQARRAFAGQREGSGEASRRNGEQLIHSARRKLELLGVTDKQIAAIEASGEPQTHLVVYAPLGGTIVSKRAMEGMYVRTGDVLYEIADLTHVWLLLEVYESDLPWIQPFEDVLVTAEALPGERFFGQIAFVDPVVDRATRTVAVRVNVVNTERRLKPQMFVTAEIAVSLGADGRPVVPVPDGAFACPMHPWETAIAQGECPICAMPLVPLASLPGYRDPGEPAAVLCVPREALLQTGTRALAYVERAPGTYEGVAVDIGPQAQDADGRDYYVVLAGLAEGDAVVTRGGFAIDSQMQLAGKPSLLQRTDTPASAACEMPEAAATPPPADDKQTTCPVMVGNPIDPDSYIDFKGVRVYFCCPGCDKKFLASPETYIDNLPAAIRERIRAAGAAPSPADEQQQLCPVLGNPIAKDVYLDYLGVRVYFCCPPCKPKFLANPMKYIPKLPLAVRKAIGQAELAGETGDEASSSAATDDLKQTVCPVMGKPIVEDVYADYRGVRIYFCCPPCIAKFLATPEEYIPKLPAGIQAAIRAADEGADHDADHSADDSADHTPNSDDAGRERPTDD